MKLLVGLPPHVLVCMAGQSVEVALAGVLRSQCWWQHAGGKGLSQQNRGHWASLGMVLPLRSLGVVFVRGESPCVVYSCSRAA